MTIRAVFFDMGGTIETFWYDRQLRLEATPGLQGMLQAAGIDLRLSSQQLYELVSAGLDRYHQWSLECMEELPAWRVWKEFIFTNQAVDPDRLAGAGEDLMQYIELHYYHRALRPEMPAVLEAIRKMDLKIGLISNVCSRGQVPANLEKYGIRHYFNPIVLSSEYGRRKPDPAIFHYAARLANVPTSECIYIGDRISRDVLGARRAGYRLAVQIRHDFDHGETDDGATPDMVITQMTELLDVLRAEMKAPQNHKPPGNPTSQIRALLFDAGDILYYRHNSDRKLADFLQELGFDPGNVSQAEKTDLRNQAYEGLIDQEQYREALLRLHGVTEPEQIERGKHLLDEEENSVRIFDGVCETLHILKKNRYLLGIVTDTAQPLHVKLRWFEQAGFGNVWDSIVSSKEMGVRKPEPRIYQLALDQLGVSAHQAAFVGHKTYELDGARAVGMKTIAFNYDPDAKADFYIKHFSDLLKVPILSS